MYSIVSRNVYNISNVKQFSLLTYLSQFTTHLITQIIISYIHKHTIVKSSTCWCHMTYHIIIIWKPPLFVMLCTLVHPPPPYLPSLSLILCINYLSSHNIRAGIINLFSIFTMQHKHFSYSLILLSYIA